MNTETFQEKIAPKTAGACLRQAREQQGLTRQFVAERLCLTPSTIRDIEEDKVQPNVAPIFFRGYICSYARLLRLPENELLAVLTSESANALATQITPTQNFLCGKKYKRRDGWLMKLTWLIAITLLGITSFWFWQQYQAQQKEMTSMADGPGTLHSPGGALPAQRTDPDTADPNTTDPDTTASNATAPPVVIEPLQRGSATSSENNIAKSELPVSGHQQNSGTDPGSSVTEATSGHAITEGHSSALPPSVMMQEPPSLLITGSAGSAGSAGTTESAESTAAADPSPLVIDFSSDCWLQVTDSSGKTLASGIQRAGSKLSLLGKIPYHLTIGAPSALHIQYQGRSVDLSRFIKSKRTARFSIPAE